METIIERVPVTEVVEVVLSAEIYCIDFQWLLYSIIPGAPIKNNPLEKKSISPEL